jgi:quercetin dioxygenase-like cupin family protein
MNIQDLHQNTKAVSTSSIFKTAEGSVMSIRILEGEQLKEHISRVPALLLCITGETVFENEHGLKLTLTNGDYVHIEPQITHWLNAISTSSLILIK